MKRFFSIVLILVLVLTIAACSNEKNPTPNTASQYWYQDENIALNDYSNEIFNFYQFDVTDHDLQMYINYYILLPNATYKEVKEGVVKKDDYIHIFVTTKDENGNIIKEYTTSENGYFLYVGLGDYIKELDSEVIGMSVGETSVFDVFVNVAGKKTPATVEVSIDYIQEIVYPEPSDELAEKAGYKSLEAFKNEYKEKLESEYAADAYKVFINSVKDKVIAEVYNHPQELMDTYIAKYEESLAYFSALYKVSEEEYLRDYIRMSREEWTAQIEKQAKEDVETELFLCAILAGNNLTLDASAYKHYLDLMAEQAGYASGEALKLAMEKQGVSTDLTRELTMNYGYDILLLTVKTRLIDWATGQVIVDYIEKQTPNS